MLRRWLSGNPARHGDAPSSIVFVVTALMHGGAEHQAVLLASEFARRGWTVRVVSMRPPEAHEATLAAAGVEVVSLNMARRIPDPRAIWRLARLLRAWRPDVVHSHMVHANLLARVTRLIAPAPVLISTAHNVTEGPRWRERAYRFTEPLCDLTTNVSGAAVERYIRVGAASADRIRYVPNGIDLTRFRRSPTERARVRTELGFEDRPVLLGVGRFEPAKDHANMLTAFCLVVEQRPDALLVLIGQGRLESTIREHADVLGVGEHVVFLGKRDDVSAVMNAADVYLMSSAWEGLPLVLLEAAAVGLPIVATDVGGNAEVVIDGESGLLVPPADPEALAHALLRMLSLPAGTRERWGQTGRAHVERAFGIEQIIARWEALYRELWERDSPRRTAPAMEPDLHARGER